MRFLISFFFLVSLYANEKLIIAKIENLKPYYYNNQIVNLKLKIITATDGNLSIKDEYNTSHWPSLNDKGYHLAAPKLGSIYQPAAFLQRWRKNDFLIYNTTKI